MGPLTEGLSSLLHARDDPARVSFRTLRFKNDLQRTALSGRNLDADPMIRLRPPRFAPSVAGIIAVVQRFLNPGDAFQLPVRSQIQIRAAGRGIFRMNPSGSLAHDPFCLSHVLSLGNELVKRRHPQGRFPAAPVYDLIPEGRPVGTVLQPCLLDDLHTVRKKSPHRRILPGKEAQVTAARFRLTPGKLLGGKHPSGFLSHPGGRFCALPDVRFCMLHDTRFRAFPGAALFREDQLLLQAVHQIVPMIGRLHAGHQKGVIIARRSARHG